MAAAREKMTSTGPLQAVGRCCPFIVKGRVSEGRVSLYDEARMPRGAKITGRALSGDYQIFWAANGANFYQVGA